MTLLILTTALRITLTLWLTGENFSTSLVCERDREEGKERKKKKERNKQTNKKQTSKQTNKDGRKEKEKEKKKKKAGVLHNRTVTMLRTVTCSPISATKWSVRGSVQVGRPTHQAAQYKI